MSTHLTLFPERRQLPREPLGRQLARAVRAHFGVAFQALIDDSERIVRLCSERPEAKGTAVDGRPTIATIYNIIAEKHEVITAESRKTFQYVHEFTSWPSIEQMRKPHRVTIYAFDGESPPEWLYARHTKSLSPGVRKVCDIQCDLSGIYDNLKPRTNPNGEEYWSIPYSLEILFGKTSLQVEMQWQVDNAYKKSTLQVIPDSFV
ncbi:hypothetical protein EXIGLDRAFT_701650 [Exidia glandulosa HHB12029]|uniref:Uncharacterized protein n=1 Tax=Exidia glandulosa HHB12029 TaxID=1314781 RepID=A0A166BPZ4_EXIGL|nr:hypothetical protein EXIGLDRAFT_701650 [Exidia glandulosa HHB12029]